MPPELLSILALLIALTSTVINYLLLRLQHDPEIIVYAIPDSQRSTIINLIIENCGKSVAHDVKFTSSRPIPSRAFGFENAAEPESMMDGPLIIGIPSFSAGEKRIITWGQYGGLTKGLSENILDITATYYSNPPMRLGRKKHKTISSIDIRSFEGTDASERNWGKQSAEQLKKIADSISRLIDIRERSLKISVISTPDEIKKTNKEYGLNSLQNSVEGGCHAKPG